MADTIGNIHEYTVSELAGAVKRAVEDGFGFVRVRGEVSKVTRAASGHVYLDLKDDKAVLASVVWKGVSERFRVRPEMGMEVVVTGKMTTFPGQSKYQLVIDSLEPAGAGALMALLEARKKKLADEGLFDPARKKKLPFLPEVIGVVTSPSGAVIRDILHRLRERFARRVLVWPTLVQGKGAEAQIAAAIDGFNAIAPGSDIPRPDVLIVARGGGSIEDLWCFNEEIVVRAAAASRIPLISAVGHETDTTLIDYAADKRAPTPTAAAEMAVPVRRELILELLNKERRMIDAQSRLLTQRGESWRAAARGLGKPEDLLGPAAQHLDRAGDRLRSGLAQRREIAATRLARTSARIRPALLAEILGKIGIRIERARTRLGGAGRGLTQSGERRLAAAGPLLDSLSHKSALRRGFALVRDAEGRLLRSAASGAQGARVALVFIDGERGATLGSDGQSGGAPTKKPSARGAKQASLFDES